MYAGRQTGKHEQMTNEAQPSKRELQPDGSSQLGFYDPFSQDWGFSDVFRLGYVHPSRAHGCAHADTQSCMNKPSAGFRMSADIWVSSLILDPLTFPNPSDPTSTSTEPELCARSPPGEDIIPAQSEGSPAIAGQVGRLLYPAIISLQSVSQLHPPRISQSWHWYLENQFSTPVFWTVCVSAAQKILNEMKHYSAFISDFPLMHEGISYEVTLLPSQTFDALFGFCPWHIFTQPASQPPHPPSPNPGQVLLAFPPRVWLVLACQQSWRPTQPWTSHQVVLEVQADTFWPCFSAVASFLGTVEAPGNASQVKSCLL